MEVKLKSETVYRLDELGNLICPTFGGGLFSKDTLVNVALDIAFEFFNESEQAVKKIHLAGNEAQAEEKD